MDEIFVTGMGVTISALLVFCGSIWLLLTVVLGARLAYFITASVTLAFILMMGIVWSFVQLGPVGDLPSFSAETLGEGGDVDFSAANSYPDEPWTVPDEDDNTQTAQKAEAESAATEAVGEAITDGDITSIPSADRTAVVGDSTRLLEQDGTTYAAVLVEEIRPETGGEPEEQELDPTEEGKVLVVLLYDPGNPLGLARLITMGIGALLVVHLFGLSRSERKARNVPEAAV